MFLNTNNNRIYQNNTEIKIMKRLDRKYDTKKVLEKKSII